MRQNRQDTKHNRPLATGDALDSSLDNEGAKETQRQCDKGDVCPFDAAPMAHTLAAGTLHVQTACAFGCRSHKESLISPRVENNCVVPKVSRQGSTTWLKRFGGASDVDGSGSAESSM